jgi:hypothetical protein
MLNLFQHNKLPPCVILKQVQDDDQGSAVIPQQHPHTDRTMPRRLQPREDAASNDRICGWWF